MSKKGRQQQYTGKFTARKEVEYLETKNAGIARGEGAYMGGWYQLKNGLLLLKTDKQQMTNCLSTNWSFSIYICSECDHRL